MRKPSEYPIKKNGPDWDTLPIVLIIIGLILAVTGLYNLEQYCESIVELPELKAEPIVVEKTEEIIEETVVVEEQAEPRIPDRDILAMVVMAEAGGEKFIGKVAVAAVVLNRASMWDMTIGEVATQEDQFVYPYYGTVSVACYEAVDYAMQNRDLFPSNMLYFRNFKYHENIGEPYIQIGGHFFSTEKEPEWELENLGERD